MDDAWASDAAEMTAVARGDDRAFTRLYRAHHPKVFRVSVGVLGDREAARDVAHECFMKLMRAAPSWEPRARVDTWLVRVAINTCLSWRRRLARLVLAPARSEDARDRERADEAPSPHERMAASQRGREARALLERLSPRDRAIVVLHIDQDLQPSEIAPLLGLSENASRVALHRALTRLRGHAATEATA